MLRGVAVGASIFGCVWAVTGADGELVFGDGDGLWWWLTGRPADWMSALGAAKLV